LGPTITSAITIVITIANRAIWGGTAVVVHDLVPAFTRGHAEKQNECFRHSTEIDIAVSVVAETGETKRLRECYRIDEEEHEPRGEEVADLRDRGGGSLEQLIELVVAGDQEKCDGDEEEFVELDVIALLEVGEEKDGRDEGARYTKDGVQIPCRSTEACPGQATDADDDVGNVEKGQAEEDVI